MKKIILLLCFLCISIGYSQTNSNYFNLSFSAGISSPSSNYSDDTFASNGSYFEFNPSYTFSKFGIGASIGQFTNPTDDKSAEFSNALGYSTSNNSSGNWKSIYYGVGPEFSTDFGKFSLSIQTRVGGMTIQDNNLEINVVAEKVQNTVVAYSITANEKTSTSYFSGGVKFGYNINQHLNIFLSSNYLSSLSESLVITEGRRDFRDENGNGIIDGEEFFNNGEVIPLTTTTKNVKPQTLNYGIGLNYTFRSKKGYDHYSSSSDNAKSKVVVRGWNPNDKTVRSSGVVAFTNPVKERAEEKKKQRKLITSAPSNNQQFKIESDLKDFSWKLIGEPIIQPKYSIEIIKMGSSLSNEWMLVAKSTKTKLSLEELFKQNNHNTRVAERLKDKNQVIFTEGQYRWRVIEVKTGTTSNYSYFNFTTCEVDFSISNEEIECLGYEGEDRKFKICFDSTYLSSSGDLTYLNASSGLNVYDQSFTPLSYTLVSPNPTLVTQVGTTASTVSYCFEVTVSSSVTSIGFGLQGDDLDPSPISCQPGVSAGFDELPDCLCDDCENIELSFDDFSIAFNGTSGNQFNFNGNINVSVPIYGIEFQVQSYSYSSNPSACTEGVTSVEESGMILMPGTTINGSTSLELSNETISGSINSNNNATKDIKYTSTSPMSGPIPINLTIGLPGPISGLDPSCCIIDYTVCIKVKVFYEDGTCKSCVFTHCFEFNNQ